MVLSAVARAAKIAKAVAAKRALKPVKTRALKPRDRALKKVSKVRKSKKHGKERTVHLTTVGKSNTSVAAKKAAAIKQIKNMNVDRSQGIIIGIKATLPRQSDRVPTWGVTTSPTLPNAKAIKIKKAIEYVKKAKVKKGQNITVKKGHGEWTMGSSNARRVFNANEITPKYLSGSGIRKEQISRRIKNKEASELFYNKKNLKSFGYTLDPDLTGSGIRKERIYSYPGWSRPTKKAPRTVAGMDKHAWANAGILGGVGTVGVASGYSVGRNTADYDDVARNEAKPSLDVATGKAIDVIKERRDQLLRKLGLI